MSRTPISTLSARPGRARSLLVLGAVAALAAGGSAVASAAWHGSSAQAQPPESSASVSIPEDWIETIAVERLDTFGSESWFTLEYLYRDVSEVGTIEAEEIVSGPVLAGEEDVECEGSTSLDGGTVNCVYQHADTAAEMSVQVRLVTTAYDSTALLFSMVAENDPSFTVPAGAELGLGGTSLQISADATAEDLEHAAVNAVTLAHRPDGDLPAELAVSCEVLDEGEHGLCELTGTPEGAGDGSWYLTAQDGLGGDVAYVVTRLPEGDPGC